MQIVGPLPVEQREHHDVVMEMACVTFDCADPHAVASFWNDAFGWGGVATTDDGTGAVCGPRSGGWYLEFVRVPEPKRTKNRVHLGCSAGSLEALDGALERLRQLGASVVWEEEFARDIAAKYRNVVFRDLEGNEFCLSGGELGS